MIKALKILAFISVLLFAGCVLVWGMRIPIINSIIEIAVDNYGIENTSVQVEEIDFTAARFAKIRAGQEIELTDVIVSYQVFGWTDVKIQQVIVPNGVIDISHPDQGIWKDLQALTRQNNEEVAASAPLLIPDIIFENIAVTAKPEGTDLTTIMQGQVTDNRNVDASLTLSAKFQKYGKVTEVSAEEIQISGDLNDELFRLLPSDLIIRSEFLGPEIPHMKTKVSGEVNNKSVKLSFVAETPVTPANANLSVSYDRELETIISTLILDQFSFTPEGLQPSHFYPDIQMPLLTGDISSRLNVTGRLSVEEMNKTAIDISGEVNLSNAMLPGGDYLLPTLKAEFKGTFDGINLLAEGEVVAPNDLMSAGYHLDFDISRNDVQFSTILHNAKVGQKGIDLQKLAGAVWPKDIKLNGNVSGDAQFQFETEKLTVSGLDLRGQGIAIQTPQGGVDRLRFQMKVADYEPGAPLIITLNKLSGQSRFQTYGATFKGGKIQVNLDKSLQAGTYALKGMRLSEFGEVPWNLPLIIKNNGKFNLNEVTFEGQGTTDVTGPLLSWRGQHSLDSSNGSAEVELWDIPFSKDGLQVNDLADINVGNLVLDGDLGGRVNVKWSKDDFGGNARVSISDLDLERDGMSIDGINGSIEIDQLLPIKISKAQTITAKKIFAGLPIEDPELHFRLVQEKDAPVLFIDRLLLQIFKGAAEIKDGVIDLANETNDLQMNFYKLSLEELMSLGEFEDVVATGALSGAIPLRFDGNKLIIDGGELVADGPGVVKMKSEQAREALSLGGEQTKILLDILENFNYSHLSLKINKPETGEDVIALSAKGGNPNVENNRPVILNVNLSTNLDKIFNTMLEAYRLSEEALRATVKDRKK